MMHQVIILIVLLLISFA
ncbi:type I toxin-antitoxin system Ibs family toxin, partial [Salmonella enterica]